MGASSEAGEEMFLKQLELVVQLVKRFSEAIGTSSEAGEEMFLKQLGQ
jgi:hypothetical protein